MTRRVGPIDSAVQAATNPSWHDYELLWFLKNYMGAGVVAKASGGFSVAQRGAGANMSVDVAAGDALVEITNTNIDSTTYKVPFRNSATYNVAIATADATNPRIDLIYLKVDVSIDPDVSSGNIGTILVAAGTPAGSPSVPATPANCLALARVAVSAGATSIVTANITDLRVDCKFLTTVLEDVLRQGMIRNYATTVGGTADAVTAVFTPPLASLVDKTTVWVVPASTNTGAMTFAPDGLTVKDIKKYASTALAAGDVQAKTAIQLQYNSADDNWKLLTPIGNAPPAAPALPVTNLLRTRTVSTDTINSTTAAVDISNSSYSIGANTLAAGDIIRFEYKGYASHANGSSLVFQANVGAVAMPSANLNTNSGSPTADTWYVHGWIQVYSTGVSGKIGYYVAYTTGKGSSPMRAATNISFEYSNQATVTLDTTVANIVKLTCQTDNNGAGNFCRCQSAYIDKDN